MKRRRVLAIPKPGTLAMKWGIASRHDDPDVCILWGAGASKRDGSFLHYVLCCKRERLDWKTGSIEHLPSFIDELKERGYDIETLRFSIRKKQA